MNNDTQRTHEKRLPYGLWVDTKLNTETLFDRDYLGIATRSLATPWEIEFHSDRKFSDHSFEGWFYNDSNSPSLDVAMRMWCQIILGEFVSGLDVRMHLTKSPGAKVWLGNYLPRTPISLADYVASIQQPSRAGGGET